MIDVPFAACRMASWASAVALGRQVVPVSSPHAAAQRLQHAPSRRLVMLPRQHLGGGHQRRTDTRPSGAGHGDGREGDAPSCRSPRRPAPCRAIAFSERRSASHLAHARAAARRWAQRACARQKSSSAASSEQFSETPARPGCRASGRRRDLIQQQLLEGQPPPRRRQRLLRGGKMGAAQREIALAQVKTPSDGLGQILGPAAVAGLQRRLHRGAHGLGRNAGNGAIDGNPARPPARWWG